MAFTKSERLKIIVWGTGYVGKMVLRDLIGHPLFELVGVIVNNPEKDGVDVGTLIGRDPIGLACSTDIDEVLSRDAVAGAQGRRVHCEDERLRTACHRRGHQVGREAAVTLDVELEPPWLVNGAGDFPDFAQGCAA